MEYDSLPEHSETYSELDIVSDLDAPPTGRKITCGWRAALYIFAVLDLAMAIGTTFATVLLKFLQRESAYAKTFAIILILASLFSGIAAIVSAYVTGTKHVLAWTVTHCVLFAVIILASATMNLSATSICGFSMGGVQLVYLFIYVPLNAIKSPQRPPLCGC